MRDAGGEKSDGTQFVSLHEAAFELFPVGDVVEDDQTADLLPIFRDERGNGEIDDGFAGRSGGGDEFEATLARAARFA